MTLEIIVFISAILFGILWYWRESRNNGAYRFVNKLTHSKKLQMQPENQKGFIHKQNLLLRLVWITMLFALAAAVISFATPINAFYVQYFVSAIVGTLIGTYIASLFIFAQESTNKENLDKAFKKGKDFVDELTDGDRETRQVPKPVKVLKTETENNLKPETEAEPKKSARDRLKDKGMIK